MAEVATSVLHNVGNVLNSVNVSATLIAEKVTKSRGISMRKVVTLFQEHEHDLGMFLTQDPKGRQIPSFLATLTDHLDGERADLAAEILHLQKNVGHIKEIVARQQSYAKVSGVTESVRVADLVEDALNMNISTLHQPDVRIIREFAEVPGITVEKHKVLQILINLMRNARYACDDRGGTDKQMTVRIANGEGRIRISVADNGVGISLENLTRIFSHGFTTRKQGHGFGLHNSVLTARELGGDLKVHSEGPGQGAEFILELPC